jgi:threonylcarbamoyladenosine tRNA methylthiotransferase MtaB
MKTDEELTLGVVSLGCKLNQSEGEAIADLFLADGYTRVDRRAPAAVTVINTCAVTSRAEFQSRQALRRGLRQSSGGLVVATGCYAQLRPTQVADTGAHLVVGNSLKEHIPHLVRHCEGPPDSPRILVGDPNAWTGFQAHTPTRFGAHTRAFLKVQEGCDLRCTFCTVRLARGRSRSLPPNEVARRARITARGGHGEVVLTGVNLGSYGRDLSPRSALHELLSTLDSLDSIHRVRLGSVEPQDIDRSLLEVARHSRQFCPHFHIPLQSGSTRVLSRMGRRCGPERYRQVVASILDYWPSAAIGADLIAGFPGESEQDFLDTVRLIDGLPLAYLHVFPYSPRSGTRAYDLRPEVPPYVRTERAAQLRDLGAVKKRRFLANQVGTRPEVLLERKRGDGTWEGLTRNYVRVAVRHPRLRRGQLARVRVTSVAGERVSGCLASTS